MNVKLSEIIVGDRMRKDLGDLTSLKESLARFGLIHPIVINQAKELIAGGRRFAAASALGWEEIPVTYKETLSPDVLRELELEENVRRKDMSWQERVCCVAEIHALKTKLGILNNSRWGQRETGELLGMQASDVNIALKLAKHIQEKDELVLTAFHPRDALTKLLRRNEDLALARLAKLEGGNAVRAVAPIENAGEIAPSLEIIEESEEAKKESITFPLSKMLFQGDMLNVLGEWPAECVDHIVCDPPYGIDVSMMQQNNINGGIRDVNRIEDTHNVEDNLRLFELMLPLLYKVSRPHSFVVMWCDYMNFRTLHDLGVKAGFKVQRWPLVWHKTHSCINSFAGKNYTKNTEIAIVMRRENATLTKAQSSSIVVESNDLEQRMYNHPFVKPHNVWKFITTAVATPGQTILDPFAGVGSGLISFITSGFVPLGIELESVHYNTALERLKQTYKVRYSNYQSVNFT